MYSDEQFTVHAEKYMNTVFRVAFNYLKSHADAEDVTQNVLIKLYHTKKVFEDDAHMKHWLIRVAINECKKMLISPWRKSEPIEDYAETLIFKTPEHSELFHKVMALKKKYRMVIYLYYYEDYKADEISEILGIPRATVNTHLMRGRKCLKTSLMMEAKEYVR